jgi:hypothetical protein
MGMPINHYSFFENIANKKEQELEAWFNFDFSLFGYIIHSPKLNPEFDEELQRSFQRLNLITGEDFLFTSFVDPPKAWVDWISNNEDRYKSFTSRFNWDFYHKEQIKNPRLIIKTLDSSLTALLIAEELGINTINLPFLAITPHPNEKYFYMLNLKKETLLSHMAYLTELAANIKMGIEVDKAIQDLGLPLKKIEIEVPLANKFYKLSLRLIEVSRNSKKLSELRVKLSNVENGFSEFSGISKIPKNENDLLFEGYDIVSKNIKKAIYNNKELRVGESEDFDSIVLASCLGLNNEEVLELQKYIEVSTYTFLVQGAKLKLIYSEFFGDPGPFILPFGKAFEIEMSYSLVHWIRKEYTIQLPKYFYEYEPNKEVIIGDSPSLNFNSMDHKSKEWKSPMLGGQMMGLSIANKDKQIHPFESRQDFQMFLNLGFNLKNIRNNACHPNISTVEDLEAIIGIWNMLLQKGFLKRLYELKNTYRE